MKRPGLFRNLLLAFGLAAAAGLCFEVLGGILPYGALARDLVLAAAGAYVLYLLRGAGDPRGRVATFVVWVGLAAGIWLLSPTFLWYAAAHTTLIWLVRVLYYHRTFFGALADLGLSGLSLAASVATLQHTNSFFLTLWVYFLSQALFVCLPTKSSGARQPSSNPEDVFERAYQNADQALRKLSVR